MAQPKLLHLDIERSPVLATIWQLFDLRVGIDQLLGDSEILCCAMSWEGSDEVSFTSKWKDGRKGMQIRLTPRTGEPIDTLAGVGVGDLNAMRRLLHDSLLASRGRSPLPPSSR